MEKLRKFPKIAESLPLASAYAFGPYRMDLRKRLVFRNSEPIPFSPKDFDLLLALVEQAGEVLVKEQLMQRVWPDTIVEEGNLNRHISTLRKTLGESPGEHEYIVTVPGRGYRFVAAVRDVSAENGQAPEHSAGRGGARVPDISARERAADVPRAGLSAVAGPSPTSVVRRRPLRLWVAIVVVLIAAVGVAGARLLVLRSKPILKSSDHILIGDFENDTGDSVFDDTLKQGVSVQLGQSPYVNILSDERVRATLRLMTRPPDTRLIPEVAREVCQRAEGKLYITGALAKLGKEYVLGVKAVDCATGDTLAQQQVSAKSKEQVLEALDRTSRQVRRTLGESLSTLQKYATPLEQATTPSLQALNAFTQGNLIRDRKGESAAIPFFQRAVELDPQFALAYDALGLTYSNLDEPGLASENITKAYALRERTSELERLQIAANYSQIVTGELEKVNQVSALWAQTYPNDPYPHNLVGVNFEFLGQYDKAIAEVLEAIRLHPDGVVLRSDLMEDYIALNQLEQAKATFRSALDRKLDHAYLHANRYGVAFLELDQAEMDRQVGWAKGQPGAEDLLYSLDSDTMALRGNLARARELSQWATDSALHNGQKETAALWQMNAALREAEFGNFDRSRRQIRAALALAPSRDVRILGALGLARIGDVQPAGSLANDLAKDFPGNTVVNHYWLPVIRAAIDIAQKKPGKAVETLQVTMPYDFAYPNPQVGVGRLLYPPYLRGEAFLRLGQADKAIREYQKFLDNPSVVVNCPLGSLARLQLARAYGAMGDKEKARLAYSDVFKVWKDSGGGLALLLQARKEYAKIN